MKVRVGSLIKYAGIAAPAIVIEINDERMLMYWTDIEKYESNLIAYIGQADGWETLVY